MMNFVVIALPAFLTGAGSVIIDDARFPLVALLFSFWIACDLTADGEQLEHYRRSKCVSDEHAWVRQAIGFAVLALVHIGVAELTLAGRGQPEVICMMVGTILFLSGLLLRWISMRALGRYFTTHLVVLYDQHLQTTGVYRYIRHPFYSGLLLTLTGLCVILQSRWSTGILGLVVLPLVLLRIQAEERVMRMAFGDQYGRYLRRTKRLLPFIF